MAGPLALGYDTGKLGAASPSVAGHLVLRYLPSDGRVHFVHQRNCQCERVVVQGFRALHVPTVWEEKDDGAAVSAADLPVLRCTSIRTFFRLTLSIPFCLW